MIKQQNIKKQTRKVGVAGSFQNQLQGNNSTTPKVGEGATVLMYSDREAYEVLQVSEDGNSCVIRQMGANHIGKFYGDERYEYFSDENEIAQNLEWNDRQKCWGFVTYEVQIIKSLVNKYSKEYGYGWRDIFLSDNNMVIDDLYEKVYEDNYYNKMKLIKGITKEYKNFNKVSIIFGVMEKYRDPHF